MTDQPLPTEHQMLIMVNDFLIATNILAVEEFLGEKRVITPKLVLSAFVLEIELKCLLKKRGIGFSKSSGHNLKALFDLLPKPDQSRVKEIHREQSATRGISTNEADTHFHESFEVAKNDFVVVRYIYERVGGHNTRNLGSLILAVYAYIFEVCPEWTDQKLDFGP